MLTGTYRGDDLAGSSFASRRRRAHSPLARIASIVLLVLIMIAGSGIAAPGVATAGQGGTINTNGVEVFAHLTDFTVIDYLGKGDRVDIFWGPEDFMYEVHYNGTIGWVWAEFLDPDGSSGSGAGSSSASSSSSAPSDSSSSSAEMAGAWSWSAWAMVDADSLNVRNDASSSAGVVDSYSAGEWIEVIGNDLNGYSPINHFGDVAWVATTYLSWDGEFDTASSSSSPPSESSNSSAETAGAWSWSAWAMVDADSLNVRNDASSSAGVIDSYSAGEWIEVIGNDLNGYSPINHFGDVAWVATTYLSWDGEFNHASVSTGSSSNAGGGSSDSGGERWIDVNARTGQVTLYIGDSAQATYWGSVGFDTSPDGFYATAVGTFHVYAMYEPIAYTDWAGAYITHWVGFDASRFNGFHSYSKDVNGAILPNGGGKTGGCVALPPAAIQAVFDFSHIGMRVEVHR